ncbi:hypothetical protein AKJ16_DCAP26844 [Drosera capensis]
MIRVGVVYWVHSRWDLVFDFGIQFLESKGWGNILVGFLVFDLMELVRSN